ncbi:MAG: hypothetical protein KDA28_04605, partial [Phycisphaerales bacterium]|nr:hypothetical protein [Phycisphaerales bacterium]
MVEWFLIGAGAGVVVSIVVGRWIVRRGVSRLRAAERRARVAERMAEVGAMTRGLAHEIKNPLSTIGLNTQLLGELIDEASLDDEDRARASRRVQALSKEVERLRDVLTDFLEYAGEVRLVARRVDLNEVASEIADFYMPQASKEGVRLRPDLAPGTLQAELDVALVKQAALNLLLNATQAMHGQTDRTRELIIRTRRDGDQVQLHVIDTGPGMDDETVERLFTPYFTTKKGGSGLGLPTARRLVDAHGGR